MSSSYADTAFPADPGTEGQRFPNKSFHQLKYELSRISEAVLEAVLKINEPSYSTIQSLQDQLNSFERSVPYELRCRTALTSLPSLYPDTLSAIVDSPELDRRNLTLTLQVGTDVSRKNLTLTTSNSLWRSRSQKRYFF